MAQDVLQLGGYASPFSGKRSLKDDVKEGLRIEASKEPKKQKTNALQKDLEEFAKLIEWKQIKSQWKTLSAQISSKLSKLYMARWRSYLKDRAKERKDNNGPLTSERIQEILKSFNGDLQNLTTEIRGTYESALDFYVDKYNEIKKPKKNKTYDEEWKLIVKKAEKLYHEDQKVQIKLAKQILKTQFEQLDKQIDINKINEKFAEIPMKIQDTINDFNDMLNKLLGRTLKSMSKDDPFNYDPAAICRMINQILGPALGALKPITAVTGEVPIVGALGGMISNSMSGPSKITKEKLAEALAKFKPQIPSNLWSAICAIADNISAVMASLPMTLVNLIFQMLKVIYSKLEIITSVIPLGNLFPLTLIPAAIKAVPLLLSLMWNLTPYVKNFLIAMVKRKIAEALCLHIPEISTLDEETLEALKLTISDSKTKAKKTEADEKKTYSDVTQDLYSSLSSYGYTYNQIKRVEKDYKTINNGSLDKLKHFRSSGKVQKTSEISDGLKLSLSGYYKYEKDFKRDTPSVSAYEEFANSIKNQYGKSFCIHVDEYVSLPSLMGEWYEMYKKQLKEYSLGVILNNKIEPINLNTQNPLADDIKVDIDI